MSSQTQGDEPRTVYVLQTCYVHDETVVSGVTMDEAVAKSWVGENPLVEEGQPGYDQQQIFRSFEAHTLIEAGSR